MSEATGKKAVLQLDGKEIELPIYSGTLGPDVIEKVCFYTVATQSTS